MGACTSAPVTNKDQLGGLHLAAKKGNCRQVISLVHQGKDINEKHDVYGRTPLYYACASKNVEVVRYLLDHGALDTDGSCYLAAPRGSKKGETIRSLLLHHACRNSPRSQPSTSLESSTFAQLFSYNDSPTANSFTKDASERSVGTSSQRGLQKRSTSDANLAGMHKRCVETAVGAEGNAPAPSHPPNGEKGRIKVWRSVSTGQLDALAVGGEKSIYSAARKGNLARVQFLARTGADVLAPHPIYGRTPLYCACVGGHVDVVRYFLACGASDFDGSCYNDATPEVKEVLRDEVCNGSTGEGSSDSSSHGGLCCICLNAEVKYACVPCGHMCMCTKCANCITNTEGKCPICRVKINTVLKIFEV